MRRLVMWWVAILVCGLAVSALPATGRAAPAPSAAPAAYGSTGPYFTFLFSRTEITAAITCLPNSVGIARLDTEVAPYLAGKGFVATGTLQTGTLKPSARTCTHSSSSLMASWADATMLAQKYGWTFVSHTATYPADISALSPERQYAETCGSAAAIDAHGLPGGHGLIAYPGAHPVPVDVQTTYAAKCFAWGRKYNSTGTTFRSAASVSPYWQLTEGPNGGPCNVPTASCYTIPAVGSTRYVLPAQALANLRALGPDEWMTLQMFILVKGTNPPGSKQRWDCTSTDARLHWTTDNERYCLRDWKKVVDAVAARPDVQVTDPLTVGVAWGRPAQYPTAAR